MAEELKVEQVGGFAGFGGPHLKASGVVRTADLSPTDRATVESLFNRSKRRAAPVAPTQSDQFKYRITRTTSNGTEITEALESEVPEAVKASVVAKVERPE